MPYKSRAQEAYFNANRDKIGGKVVDEFNAASKGMKLPEHVKKAKVTESHSYDHERPVRKVVSRYSKGK